MQNDFAFANDEFNSLNKKNRKAVFSYISDLSKKQKKIKKASSKSVKEKLKMLDFFVGIVSSDTDFEDARSKRILDE